MRRLVLFIQDNIDQLSINFYGAAIIYMGGGDGATRDNQIEGVTKFQCRHIRGGM